MLQICIRIGLSWEHFSRTKLASIFHLQYNLLEIHIESETERLIVYIISSYILFIYNGNVYTTRIRGNKCV